MTAYATIRAAQTATPAFNQAREIRTRLTAAIALGTPHTDRLHKLRDHIRYAIDNFNEQEMRGMLALYGPAFESAIVTASAFVGLWEQAA